MICWMCSPDSSSLAGGCAIVNGGGVVVEETAEVSLLQFLLKLGDGALQLSKRSLSYSMHKVLEVK